MHRRTDSANSFGLYIHTPFCSVKCGYCDFYSLPLEHPADNARSAASLLAVAELLSERDPWRDRPIHSLYFGGGTPSLLPESFFAALLAPGRPVRRRLLPGAEITVEMNPESVRPEWLAALAELGVTRASLGVQSFNSGRLRLLDRIHQPGQAAQVLGWLRDCGIPDFGLDLIYQLPGQDEAELADELEQALSFHPVHISAYGLGFEPGTRLEARRRRGEVEALDPDRAARLYLQLSRTLRRAGYLHYEVSNFALPGHGARHNASYWWEGDVLAVGPSAVSSWTDGEGGRRRARFAADWRSFADSADSVNAPAPVEETPELSGAWLEALFLGLRWQGGLDLERLARRFGAVRVELLRTRARGLGSHGPREIGRRAWLNRQRRLLGSGAGLPGQAPQPDGAVLVLSPERWLLLDEVVLRLVD